MIKFELIGDKWQINFSEMERHLFSEEKSAVMGLKNYVLPSFNNKVKGAKKLNNFDSLMALTFDAEVNKDNSLAWVKLEENKILDFYYALNRVEVIY